MALLHGDVIKRDPITINVRFNCLNGRIIKPPGEAKFYQCEIWGEIVSDEYYEDTSKYTAELFASFIDNLKA